MSLQGQPIPNPPKLWELWPLIRDRLDVAAMAAPLRGAGRVRLPTDTFPAQEGGENTPWGRVMVLPMTGTTEPERFGHDVLAPFLVRVDYHRPAAAETFTVQRWMEQAHEVAYNLLHGWQPAGMQEAEVNFRISRVVAPQTVPLWDYERDLWIMSAQYNVLVERPGAA